MFIIENLEIIQYEIPQPTDHHFLYSTVILCGLSLRSLSTLFFKWWLYLYLATCSEDRLLRNFTRCFFGKETFPGHICLGHAGLNHVGLSLVADTLLRADPPWKCSLNVLYLRRYVGRDLGSRHRTLAGLQ